MAYRSILIKPASGACNMHCDYCFYKDEQCNRDVRLYGIMSKETAHNLIDKALEGDSVVSFAFQGGEPTLAGLDYFKDFVEYANSIVPGRCSFALQTNGYAIDREWARFFHDNNFLIGLSMDGPKAIHDKYRHSGDRQNGSFKNVYRTSQILKSEKVEFNILITVTNDVAMNIDQIQDFFVRNDFRYLQYIPCIDPIGSRGTESYSLSVDAYGEFLKKLFDRYFTLWQEGRYVSIRFFDNLVSMLIGQRPEACGMIGICGLNYVVEADGGVYPCDFYVLDDYKLGNINDASFDDFDAKRDEIGFIEKSKYIDPECKACRYFPICRGGCRRDRDDFALSSSLKLNYLCSAFKSFYAYSLPRMEIMARAELEARMQRGR